MDDKTRKALLIAGLGVSLSASAALMYFLFKPERDDEEYANNLLQKAREGLITTSRHTLIRVNVPTEMVGSIIGRQGIVIKELQNRTNTRIRFEEKEEEPSVNKKDRILIISGTGENAQEAETLIHSLIYNQLNVVTEEIFIPVRACGRIIGRNGDTIRHMCYTSKAKITLDRGGDERDPDNMKLVTIRGTKAEIDFAITLIDEKLAEEEAFRQKVNLSSAGRTRFQHRLALNFDSALNLNANSPDNYQHECLVLQSPDGFSEIFISAVIDPSKFWVQLVGTKSIELDKLVDDMTDFYSLQPNRDQMAIGDNLNIGDLVAAPFEKDISWYRVKVEKIIIDEYSPSNVQVELHYVDFGDNVILSKTDICTLGPQFKFLPLQAIECCLAYVKPLGGIWKPEAIELFEKLTYSAQWKSIMAKPVVIASNDNEKKATHIELIDTNCEEDIKIAKSLVRNKFAVWDTKEIN